ncbi:TPA: type II secretion system protein [Candidatus Scatousia excrementigallinarum]|uniref:Type II secretion system protein n=1 Tax=Candidatus Scatousia excrementigallinarum TaxID=2840935 RepID=A0A9D1EYE3_9BACT|nr:type II secretion system protein [Candidatus Scatousia excrementigallinarum]
MKNRSAFSLAEVLITLGIIGIVASMTMPVLIERHQKKVIATSLKKFYTLINQAVQQSIIDNGDTIYWTYPASNNSQEVLVFYDTYLRKYIKSLKVEEIQKEDEINGTYNYVAVYLPDGSAFLLRGTQGMDIEFYPQAKNISKGYSQRTRFAFQFHKNRAENVNPDKYSLLVEPYTYNWDGTREGLLSNSRFGCAGITHNYCTKLIQDSGWEIPNDYPW